MLDLLPMQIRQKVEQVKSILPCRRKSPQPTPWSRERHKGMQTGTGQVLDGSSRGLNTASMPADRTQANQEVGKVNRFLRLYKTLLPENLWQHCWEWPAGITESEIKLLIQENSRPQNLIVYTDGSVTKDQQGWGFTVKQGATTIHEDGLHIQLNDWGGNSKRKQSRMPSAGLPQEVTVRPHMPSSSQIQ